MTVSRRWMKFSPILKFIKMYAWVKAFSQSVQSEFKNLVYVYWLLCFLSTLATGNLIFRRIRISYVLIISYDRYVDRDLRDCHLWPRLIKWENWDLTFPKITQLVMRSWFSFKTPYLYCHPACDFLVWTWGRLKTVASGCWAPLLPPAPTLWVCVQSRVGRCKNLGVVLGEGAGPGFGTAGLWASLSSFKFLFK